MKNKRGFTLIEMIVTIALILLLTTVFTSSLVTYITKSQSVSSKVDSHLSSYSDAKNVVDSLGNRGLVSPAAVTTYKVTFKLMTNTGTPDERVVSDILSGGSAAPPPTPNYPGFAFDHWEGTYTNVTKDEVVNARYKAVTAPAQFNVTFTYKDSTGAAATPVTVTVTSGGDATPPTTTGYPGFVFDGWDDTYTNVTSSKTINAKYKAIISAPVPVLNTKFVSNPGWGGYKYACNATIPKWTVSTYVTITLPAGAVATAWYQCTIVSQTNGVVIVKVPANNTEPSFFVNYSGASVFTGVVTNIVAAP